MQLVDSFLKSNFETDIKHIFERHFYGSVAKSESCGSFIHSAACKMQGASSLWMAFTQLI